MSRKEDARWSKLVIDWIPEGFRRRGRPKNTVFGFNITDFP